MVNTVTKLSDRVYKITEVNSIHRYVLLGDEKALLVDTGYGFVDVTPLIREITDLPLMVVNTHGHSDHSFGNYFFKEAYIHPDDIPSVWADHRPEKKIPIIEYRTRKNPTLPEEADLDAFLNRSMDHVKLIPLNEGDVLDLGGVTLNVIHIPGHSKGSVALYSPELKIMFGGDSVNSHPIWYVNSTGSLPISTFLRSLEKLKGLNLEIEAIYPGHGNSPLGVEVMNNLIACIHDLAERDEGDPTIENSGMVGRQHSYNGVSIIYSEEHLALLRKDLKGE
ncbi:MAG: MBL fold metallo-hydrolase [Clostridiales bacterium]|nr:MBL fold metallo-hydrolase [Clostridiales bacterium]